MGSSPLGVMQGVVGSTVTVPLVGPRPLVWFPAGGAKDDMPHCEVLAESEHSLVLFPKGGGTSDWEGAVGLEVIRRWPTVSSCDVESDVHVEDDEPELGSMVVEDKRFAVVVFELDASVLIIVVLDVNMLMPSSELKLELLSLELPSFVV